MARGRLSILYRYAIGLIVALGSWLAGHSAANAQEQIRGDALKGMVIQGVAQGTAVKLLPIALTEAASVGSGYASSLNSMRAVSIEPTGTYDEEQFSAPYDFHYVEDYSELRQSLAIKASAAYGGVSARASMLREARMSKTSAYVLFKTTVTTHRTVQSQYKLNVDALQAAAAGPPAFFNRFGDSFVSSITYGGELIAMMEFSSDSAAESQSLRSSVRGQVSGFSGSASASQVIETLSRGRKVRVTYFQTGGDAGREVVVDPVTGVSKGGLLTVSPSELMLRFRDFPTEVKNNKWRAWPLYAELKDYSVTDWPTGVSPVTSIQDQDELDRLSEVRLLIAERLATATAVAKAGKLYPATTVNAAKAWQPYLKFLDKQLEEFQLPYLRRLPQKPKRELLTFEQYTAELLLNMPGSVSRANAGRGCDPYDLDITRSGACLLGPDEDPLPVVPWPEVVSIDKHVGWQVKQTDRGGAFHIPCATEQQPTADRVCRRTGPNDGIVAIPATISSRPGCGCGCNLVEVTCIRFAKLDEKLFKSLPLKPTKAELAQSSSPTLTTEEGRTVVRFSVQASPDCGRSIGSYSIRARVVGPGGHQATNVSEPSYWFSSSNEATVVHPLPGVVVDGSAVEVKQMETYCDPVATRPMTARLHSGLGAQQLGLESATPTLSLKNLVVATAASVRTDPLDTVQLAAHATWKPHVEWVLNELNSCRNAMDDRSPCNRFVGQALQKIWSADDFSTGKPAPNDFMLANSMAERMLTARDKWIPLGSAGTQSALDQAQVQANKGYAVVAVIAGRPAGHVAVVIPGTLKKSNSWDGLRVPNSASMLLDKPNNSYVGKPLSFAFSGEKYNDVKLYFRVK